MGAFLLIYSSSFAQENATFRYSPRMLYTYTWSSTNGFEATITDKPEGNTIKNLSSGLYRVTVTDCAGASMIDSVYVNRIIDKKHDRKETGRKWNKNSLFENLPPFLLRRTQPNSSL